MSNIIVVSEKYWPNGSGGELATHLILGLLKDYFKVAVITGSCNHVKHPNVEYIYEPLLSRWRKVELWINVVKFVRSARFREIIMGADVIYLPGIAYPIIPHVKSLGKKVVIHLHGYSLLSYTAMVLAPYEEHKDRITRDDIRLATVTKGLRHYPVMLSLWWLPKLARKWVVQADKVICVSKRHAEIVLDYIPDLKDKVEVIYNPLPSELIGSNYEKELGDIPTFLYVGGDSYVKGFNILLKVMNAAGKSDIRIKFVLAGNYSIDALRRLNELRMKHATLNITVLGRAGYSNILKQHRESYALIFPSITEEPLPYAVIESMVLGTIPIASRVGGIPEIVANTPAEDFTFSLGPRTVEEALKVLRKVVEMSPSEVVNVGRVLRDRSLSRFNNNRIKYEFIKVFSQHY